LDDGTQQPSPSGYWAFCEVCAEVYWQPYGKTSREAHGGPYGHRLPTSDPEAFERAEDEADELNRLEQTWIAQP